MPLPSYRARGCIVRLAHTAHTAHTTYTTHTTHNTHTHVVTICLCRVKSLPGHTLVWRTGDGYELLSLILIVITAFASHPFQRGYASFVLWYAKAPSTLSL
jgi:hypothetical protein